MKVLLLSSFVLVSTFAVAQQHNSLSRNINDDGKTLSIRVNGTVDGKAIDYDRTFDVSNLSKQERTALRERALDSLNVSIPEPPKAPRAPRAPVAPRAPRMHSESVTINSDGPTVTASNSDTQTIAVGGKQPYTKEVNYNLESGKLYLRYRFEKDGDNVTYERSLDARNKSQEERQRLIEDIEKSIGVPNRSK